MYVLNPDIFNTKVLVTNDKIVKDVLLYLRGFFQNIYVGGSYATFKAFGLDSGNAKDVDIFILGKRNFETWALSQVLMGKFDEIDMPDAPQYYKIQNQFKRVKAVYNGVKFDLIFCNLNIDQLIYENTASDLSKMYYKLTYCETEADRWIHLNIHSKHMLDKIKETKIVEINAEIATEAHYIKMVERVKDMGLQLFKNKY